VSTHGVLVTVGAEWDRPDCSVSVLDHVVHEERPFLIRCQRCDALVSNANILQAQDSLHNVQRVTARPVGQTRLFLMMSQALVPLTTNSGWGQNRPCISGSVAISAE